MHSFTMALAFGLGILWTAGSGGAATPGAVCRVVCAPRIAEQCAFLTKRALKACRKPVLRACRETTPAVACGTSAELLRELGDRLVIVPDQTQGTSRDITLCATGDFRLRELLADGTDAPEVVGQWNVRVAGGRLVLDLAGQGPLPLDRAANGGLIVDGIAALVSGDRGVCVPQVVGDDPDQKLVEIARKVSDRALSTVEVDAARTTKRDLTLCADGTYTELVEIDDGGSPVGFAAHGRWTLGVKGRAVSVALDDGTGTLRSAAIGTGRGGEIVLDDAPADVRDARAACEAAPLAP